MSLGHHDQGPSWVSLPSHAKAKSGSHWKKLLVTTITLHPVLGVKIKDVSPKLSTLYRERVYSWTQDIFLQEWNHWLALECLAAGAFHLGRMPAPICRHITHRGGLYARKSLNHRSDPIHSPPTPSTIVRFPKPYSSPISLSSTNSLKKRKY